MDVDNCRRRERKYVNEERVEDDKWTSARLLNLKKAHPWVHKPALWMFLERYEHIKTVMDLLGMRKYQVLGRERERERERV